MRNKIDLDKVPHTKTSELMEGFYVCYNIAVKKQDIDDHNIRLDPLLTPVGSVVIDGVDYPLRSAGLATINLGDITMVIGRSYKFGHWYYRHTLNILYDNQDVVDKCEKKNVRKF